MSYTVMSDEILEESDTNILRITKIWNDRKRAEINTIHKEVIKTRNVIQFGGILLYVRDDIS